MWGTLNPVTTSAPAGGPRPEDPRADEPLSRRNTWGFGLGTLGRDMVAAMVTMFLMVYLTEVLDLSNSTLAAVTVVLVVLRVFDAVNDPVMGLIVDNTRSRFGKFKPWIAGGAVAWAFGTALLFTDFRLEGAAFVIAFTACYLVWEIAYTVNDISYYGMVPALSRNQTEREKIGVVARMCANIGMFAVVVGIVPITNALEDAFGSATSAWLVFAVAISVIMLAFQAITLVATRQRVGTDAPPPTRLSELFAVIARNDQLLWVTAAMFLFMTGFTATAGFGLYYFTYIYGDEGMYAIFAAILGITQIAGLLSFPLFAARLSRRQVFTLASGVCAAGYILFAFAGTSIVLIGIAGVAIFFAQAYIQLLIMMFIADCVEYGQWKLGRRNESVTFSLQPFLYKAASAAASGIVGLTLIVSGINEADGPADLDSGGIALFKFAMFGVPVIGIAISWFMVRRKYVLDEDTYANIVADLREREGAGADE